MRSRAFGLWLGVSVMLHGGLLLVPGLAPVSVSTGEDYMAVVVLEYEEGEAPTEEQTEPTSDEAEAGETQDEANPEPDLSMPDEIATPEDPLALTSDLEFASEATPYSPDASAPQPVLVVPDARPKGARQPGEGSETPNPSRVSPPRLLVGALPLTSKDRDRLQAPEEIQVRLRIGTSGRVEDVEFITPDLAPALQEALLKSTEVMRFAPAKEGSQLVSSWFPMTFVYRR